LNISRAIVLFCGGLVLLIVVCVIGALGGWRGILQDSTEPVPAMAVASTDIDPLNESRLVSVQGVLGYEKAPLDDELGIVVDDAVVLLRRVEMYQWRETCVAGVCTQSPAWSEEWIDTSTFQSRQAHSNPDDFPFTSRRFQASGIHLGAFKPAVGLILAQLKTMPRTLRLSEMPANLAASASELDGGIFLGNDPLHPVVGDLRMSYSMIPAGPATLVGVQKADRLVVPAAPRQGKRE
jgi:hypothetical protein